MTPAAIYGALTTGAMRIQGQGLDEDEKSAVVEFSPPLARRPTPGCRPVVRVLERSSISAVRRRFPAGGSIAPIGATWMPALPA